MPKSSNDIRAEVSARIEAGLKAGKVAWQKPWVGELSRPRNLQSGKPYRGLNALLLAFSDYSDPRWTTFKAMSAMNGKCRPGEKTTMVTLWKPIKIKDPTAPNGEKKILLLKYYRVLNVEQCDWPEGAIKELSTELPEGFDPLDAAEDAFRDYIDSDTELSLRWGGEVAGYAPDEHYIVLPDRERFKSAEGFYSVAFHEAGHSTARALKRDISGTFGTAKYGREELVAEMTAAFVCAELGVESDYDNSAAYIAGWMQAIQNDSSLIMQAAGQAQKAADLILLRSYSEPESTVNPTEATNVI